jgi:ribosomal protein S4
MEAYRALLNWLSSNQKKTNRSTIKKGKLISKIIGQKDSTIFQQKKFPLLRTTKKGYTHPTFLERRLDALLVHTHLVKTVFQARQFILHGKALVDGKREVRTNFIVPNFVPVTLSLSYRLKRKKELLRIIRKGGYTTYINTTAFYVRLYTNANLVLASSQCEIW